MKKERPTAMEFVLPPELRQAIKLQAVVEDRSASAIAREALEAYLSNKGASVGAIAS